MRFHALARPFRKPNVDLYKWRIGGHDLLQKFFDFIQLARQQRKMGWNVVENPEMGRSNPRDLFVPKSIDAGAPLFQVELRRRHRRLQVLETGQANSADIAGKAGVLVKVGEVMLGVT